MTVFQRYSVLEILHPFPEELDCRATMFGLLLAQMVECRDHPNNLVSLHYLVYAFFIVLCNLKITSSSSKPMLISILIPLEVRPTPLLIFIENPPRGSICYYNALPDTVWSMNDTIQNKTKKLFNKRGIIFLSRICYVMIDDEKQYSGIHHILKQIKHLDDVSNTEAKKYVEICSNF